jgi:hypothetical protein
VRLIRIPLRSTHPASPYEFESDLGSQLLKRLPCNGLRCRALLCVEPVDRYSTLIVLIEGTKRNE